MTTKAIPPKLKIRHLLMSFLMPTLVGKSLVLYFGAGYANNPGDGYGYGLLASILFTLAMIGRFLWTYRHHED